MRKQKVEYIVNITKQAMSIIAKAEAERSGVESATALFDCMENLEQFGVNSAWFDYREILMPTIKKMTPETLGKIASYGLGQGEVCKLSFRKISSFDSRTGQSHNGRKSLERLAVDVLFAAVCDRMLVLQLVKKLGVKYELAGKKYLDSKA